MLAAQVDGASVRVFARKGDLDEKAVIAAAAPMAISLKRIQ